MKTNAALERFPAVEPTAADLCRLADLTLAEFARHLTRSGDTGTVHEEDGVLLFAGAHPQPNPYRNGAIRLSPSARADVVLEQATEFFTQRGRGFALWASEHGDGDLVVEAERRRLASLETLPELVLYGMPDELPLPEGLEVRQATDEQTRRDYVQVVARAWGIGAMPHELASRVFFSPETVDAPNVAAFVAYLGGHPVSGAMTLVSHNVALGCQAATVRRLPVQPRRAPGPMTARRGLADACLCAALERSYSDLGAHFSLCQTSSQGAPVWRRLGYEPFTSYRRYFVPPSVRDG